MAAAAALVLRVEISLEEATDEELLSGHEDPLVRWPLLSADDDEEDDFLFFGENEIWSFWSAALAAEGVPERRELAVAAPLTTPAAALSDWGWLL